MNKYTYCERFGYVGSLYECDKGFTIPTHTHPADDTHDVRVIKGTVVVIRGGDRLVLQAGDIFEFDSTQPHSLVAAENGTEFFQRYYFRTKEWLEGLETVSEILD
jgi:quercetin dioxygenase-like cupin family protein